MTDKLYRKLANHLDNLPGGFPATQSGVELRILKHLFKPRDAHLALHTSLIPETARVVARRAGISAADAQTQLTDMAARGLIIRIDKTGSETTYMAAQFVIGIWEFNVDRLDAELVGYMDEYKPTLMQQAWKSPQLRTIPVGQSIQHDLEVMTYERAEALIERHKAFAVSPCICRRERKIAGDGCDKPEETCLSFGLSAQIAIQNGYGRAVDRAEMLELLRQADRAGLVLQPGNSQKINYICCCCGCCCGVLRILKTYPNPAAYLATTFVVQADEPLCTGCGVCLDRCQMDALQLKQDKVLLNPERCIGCGLCVTTCPSDCLSLKRKPVDQQPVVPANAMAAALTHARARGKLGPMTLAKMQLQSKIDRALVGK